VSAPKTNLRRVKRGRLALGVWTALVLAFLYLPIALVVIYSFNRSAMNVLWEGFTLQWYGRVWRDGPLMTALANSLIIASVTTLVSSVLGTTAAWLLYRYRFPAARMVHALVFFPMIVPEIIMGVSLLLLFAVLRIELGFTTVIIAHVTFCFPFVMIAVQARLQGLDPALEEAAMDLGATPLQAFFRVIVPYLLPAIVAGALMAFTLSVDEFVVTYFTYSAASITLPVKIYGLIKPGLNPSINALSTLLIAVTVVLVIAAGFARRLSLGGARVQDPR
jgi:spermidine/putrescine transport system permease protein